MEVIRSLYPPTYNWLIEPIEPFERTPDEDIPRLLNEVRYHYDVEDTQANQVVSQNEDDAETVLSNAIDSIQDHTTRSCAHCSKAVRVEDVSEFKRGQHLSMPGRYGTKYNRIKRRLKHVYKHHAIVTRVVSTSGMTAVLSMVHFNVVDDKFNIYETQETIDLRKKEIYRVDYVYPRYGPDEIVRRAKSMISQNRDSKFGSYNFFVNNCEHFATWCVVGTSESIQVQGVRQKIADALKHIFGDGSILATGIMRLLFNSADEIAAAFQASTKIAAYVLTVTVCIYLLYCIVMTVVHVRRYRRKEMCWSCLKNELLDLWLGFAAFGVTSYLTFVIVHFALPLLSLGPFGVPLVILLVLLSVAVQWSIPKIREYLQSPFTVDRNRITSLSAVTVGDIISFTYYGFEHVAVVTALSERDHKVSCVHYALPHLLGTRTVKEETFSLNPVNDTVKLFDSKPLFCKRARSVVDFARKRVGEQKWSVINRSDHLSYWAKIMSKPRVRYETWDDIENSTALEYSSAFIRYDAVHLMTDLELGDVVEHGVGGIVVGIYTKDDGYGRKFEIEMVRYGVNWYLRKARYSIDLNTDSLKVSIYHPAHCHPMLTRVERALALVGKKGTWWTTQRFIDHCIMRVQ